MAIALVQTAHSGTLTVTYGSAPTSGNLLVMGLYIQTGGGDPAPVAPSGWTLATSINSNTVSWTYLYYKKNCGTATAYTWTGTGVSGSDIVAAEYSGASTTGPLDKTATNSGFSTSPDSGTTATTTVANEVWVAILMNEAGVAFTSPTNSFTNEVSDSAFGGLALFDKIVSSTGTADVGATISGNRNWAGVMATFSVPVVTTFTRTVPTTAVLKSLGLKRTVPTTAVLKSFGLSRTVPSTAVLKSLGVQRTVPTTAVLTFRFTRTVPSTAVLKSLGLQRTVPSTAVLKSLGLTRTVPSTAVLKSFGLSRTVPSTAVLKITLARTVPSTAVLKSLGLIRTVPTTAVLKSFGLQRVVPTTAVLYFAGTDSGSAYPWKYIKQQLVKVYNAAGTFIDVWRDAPLLDGFKEAIQANTTPIRVKLPRRFDNFDELGTIGALGSIAQGNTVKWYLFGPGLPATGLLRYQGVIDAYEPTIDPNGEEYVTVTVTPRGSAVGDVALLGDAAFGTVGSPSTYVDPISMFNYWFNTNDPNTSSPYPYPLTLDGTNPVLSGVATQYTFENQQLIDIWNTILLLLPANYFWRVNVDQSVTLNQAPATAQNTFILGRHCVSLLYTKDWTQLKNVVYVQGGQSPTTGMAVTALAKGSDVSVYDARYLLVNETRITDQNTIDLYAAGLLTVNDQVQFRVSIRVFDYRGDPNVGLGYDIETIKVGQTCTILDPQTTRTPPVPQTYWDQGIWDVMYWDAYPQGSSGGASLWDTMTWDGAGSYWDFSPGSALQQVMEIASIDYHFDWVDLNLVALRPSQDVALAKFSAQLQNAALAGGSSVAIWG